MHPLGGDPALPEASVLRRLEASDLMVMTMPEDELWSRPGPGKMVGHQVHVCPDKRGRWQSVHRHPRLKLHRLWPARKPGSQPSPSTRDFKSRPAPDMMPSRSPSCALNTAPERVVVLAWCVTSDAARRRRRLPWRPAARRRVFRGQVGACAWSGSGALSGQVASGRLTFRPRFLTFHLPPGRLARILVAFARSESRPCISHRDSERPCARANLCESLS